MKRLLLAVTLLLGLSSTAWADKCYCVLFAHDSKPVPLPTLCHIWGTFVQVSDDGKTVKKDVCLSWAPERVSYFDVPGKGYDLTSKQSIEDAVNGRRHVRVWGPFAITKEFFDKAEAQQNKPGKYKFLDYASRKRHGDRHATNCIHHLSDIAGPLKTGPCWGWWATAAVYRRYKRRGVIEDTDDRDKIYTLLALDQYPLTRMK